MKHGVLIFEDNQQLRSSIEQMILISDELLLLGSFPNVLKVEQHVKELHPEVILMDIDMPGGMNGIDAVKKIRSLPSDVHIIMLTVFDDNKTVLEAIMAGASGYLLKKHISEKLTDAIKEVLNGGAPMSPNIARMVIASMQQKNVIPDENKYQLTSREIQILKALAEGTGYKMIAAQLVVSLDTIRTHIKNIYRKMQVHNQLEAISRARNEGVIH